MPHDGRKLWQGYYGKEPFDLRLTALRMVHRLPLIAAVTVFGILVFGGGYYVKNVLLRGSRSYAATSVYRVEYNVDSEEELQTSYINAVSWNTYMQSRMFLEMVQDRLADGTKLTDEELAESLEAFLWSDLRVPMVTVTTEEPAKTEAILRAVDEVMEQDFSLREIDSIAVIDPGRAEEVVPDVRVGRAMVLSALLSCFFAVVVLLLKEAGDDSIWLPGIIWRRYGLKVAGTLESRGLLQNMQYFFREKGSRDETRLGIVQGDEEAEKTAREPEKAAREPERTARGLEKAARETENRDRAARKGMARGHGMAVCMVQEEMKPEEVLDRLRERCPEVVNASWFAVGSPLTEPENCEALREADGILLAVKAGCRVGRKLEYVLEYLEQQDCEVTAAILWEADEKLIRRYYFGKRQGPEHRDQLSGQDGIGRQI